MDLDFMMNNAVELFGEQVNDAEMVDAVKDIDFKHFFSQCNGRLFFNRALLIDGFGKIQYDLSFVEMNLLLNEKYGTMIPNFYAFGCDAFGHQFIFSEGKVCFLNIEDATCRVVADNFRGWIQAIKEKSDYYTGESLLINWENKFGNLKTWQRLSAKMPFIAGGSYDVENLYAMNIIQLIEYNSDIAKQVFGLPDGTRIQFNIED